MSNNEKIQELVENGYDKDEMIQSLSNWLGEHECGEFLSNYLGIEEDEEEDETEEEEAYRESLNG